MTVQDLERELAEAERVAKDLKRQLDKARAVVADTREKLTAVTRRKSRSG
jgi:hypothetical protein